MTSTRLAIWGSLTLVALVGTSVAWRHYAGPSLTTASSVATGAGARVSGDAASDQQVDLVAEHRLPLISGTIAHRDPYAGMAIAGIDAKSTGSYQVGDDIPGGAILLAVYPDRVFVSHDDQLTVVPVSVTGVVERPVEGSQQRNAVTGAPDGDSASNGTAVQETTTEPAPGTEEWNHRHPMPELPPDDVPSADRPTVTAPQNLGPGAVVWLDETNKIYYCYDHPKFGQTDNGYMIPEEHAKSRGGHAYKGQTCS